MKVVHLTRLSGAKYALCSHKVDYMSTSLMEGWCVVDYTEEYQMSSTDGDPAWKWCEGCLTSDDYALFVLGDLP